MKIDNTLISSTMENKFDPYEFENYLSDEFFTENEKSEIGSLIKQRLSKDDDFRVQYEQWLEESGYDSWKELYKELEQEQQDQIDIAWENMFPEGDDDDSITDYLTKE